VLQVNQGALAGVLRRLVAAGVLDERREHVRGADRRLKVYRLTPSGEQLFQDLRSRQPPGRPSAPPTL
ncbi:MAG: PadR family transcriptional regulator, partial [Thermoplasmata archaeon]|nr:PadR family transcriptional regulator [Thermoplasmata archaeon]